MLTAEQLVDALGVVTGRPMKFEGVPPELRATELPAPDLRAHNGGRIGEEEFMRVFGQPERQTIWACERGDESSLGQPVQMHLLVEEVYHLLLLEAKGQVAHVDPTGLPRHTGSDHGHGSLGRVWHQGGGNLARLLHALVL